MTMGDHDLHSQEREICQPLSPALANTPASSFSSRFPMWGSKANDRKVDRLININHEGGAELKFGADVKPDSRWHQRHIPQFVGRRKSDPKDDLPD